MSNQLREKSCKNYNIILVDKYLIVTQMQVMGCQHSYSQPGCQGPVKKLSGEIILLKKEYKFHNE